MKQIHYIGHKQFLFGLQEIADQLAFTLDPSGYEISCCKTGTGICVEIHDHKASVTYGRDSEFFRAFSLALQYVDGADRHIEASCDFQRMGTMQNSASYVMSVDGLKEFIRQNALMGYTYLELYMEASYEVPGEPYFGYMKGRLSQQELKELVRYAREFCIDLIPSVQTLGHMADLFKWNAFYEVSDISNTLLADYERTYELIDHMLASLSACFDTPRINLGMDEAYFMCVGRYHWFVDDSRPDPSMVFIRHLKRVLSIAEKYGFTEPAIWYDNLFEINYKGYINPPEWLWKDFPKEITEAFPNVRLIFWNYVIQDTDDFQRFTAYTRQLSPEVSFASMAHGYTSFAPENYITAQLVETARIGCRICGIRDLMVTWWGGLQSTCALLPSYYHYIEACGNSVGYDFEERCKFLFGYTYTEFCMLDLPNKLEESSGSTGLAEGNNPPYYILADDPLLGIMEKHIPSEAKKTCLSHAQTLHALADQGGRYDYIFRFEAVLCETMAAKCDLSRDIKAAYDAHDLDALRHIAGQLSDVIRQLESFHDAYYQYWCSFNKTMGWERIETKLGGSILRLRSVQRILLDFADGRISRIEELEQPRLPLTPGKEGKIVSNSNWDRIATTGI